LQRRALKSGAHLDQIPQRTQSPLSNTSALRHNNGSKFHRGPRLTPPLGPLYKERTLITPSPDVREALMGFTPGDTVAQGLNIE
jgi:hypothetical protein